ncbi:hypothetical protein [Xanthobacter autotrophicus]|uniref:hypothetical protein n=1 Tax=Xanthobacter autotrophicus TaxID=280 RepID=UPI00372B3BE5
MSELRPTSRRGFLGHVAGAYLATGALTAGAVALADPLLALVEAYRDECARLDAIPGNILDDEPMPVWDALNEGRIPAATSTEGAIAALRLAKEMCEDFGGADAIPNLIGAALRFLEGGAA